MNLDVDPATVQPDDMRTVVELAGLLQSGPLLKRSVEGHTDNTGTKAHNLSLSR